VAVVLIIVFGTGVSGIAAWAIHRRQTMERREAFEDRASQRVAAIQRHLDGVLQVVRGLVDFHDGSETVTRQEFAIYTKSPLDRHKHIAALVWIELVRGSDRLAFEQLRKSEGVEGSSITERGPDGQPVPAQQREKHYVTLYVHPPKGLADGIGFDQASEPRRLDTLLRAAETGDVALSPPIRLGGSSGEERTVVLAYSPLHLPIHQGEERIPRAGPLRGFVGAVIVANDLVDAARGPLTPAGIEIQVVDADAPAGQNLLAVCAARPTLVTSPRAGVRRVTHPDDIRVGGRTWHVTCIGEEASLGTASVLPQAVLLGGLLVSVLIATNVGGGLSRARIRSLVDQRTAELGTANRRLEDELRERRLSEERMRFMTRELDHRVKNNMAAILAVVDSTLRSSRNLEEFSAAFTGRIMAMARLHTILTQTHWSGADLGSLVRQIVEPYTHGSEGRVVAKGEPVTLGPKAVSSVAMALHELATNAAKYGALSAPDGRVEIKWQREPGPNGRDQVRLTWLEGGGPPVGPPSRRGFGSELIESAVAFETEGRANIEFAPDGVRCEIVVPLTGDGRPLGAGLFRPPGG
jgi:two-component sensor histidine kinase/CHASE1-domain containing sensor protein